MTKTAWRYEIKYGPEGEANYAWVYDADGDMVCTAKTHHAEAIVARMNSTASLQGEDAVERVAGCICQNQHRRGYCTEPGCPYSTSDAVEKVKALAHRFWSIHPSTIAAMNLTREEFYVREMMALLATSLVPDEAAVRAAAFDPTNAQINSACLSFRHDYGLLDDHDRERLRFVAVEWLRAWQKEGFGCDRDEVIERCAAVVDRCNREGPYEAIASAKRIRALKSAVIRAAGEK